MKNSLVFALNDVDPAMIRSAEPGKKRLRVPREVKFAAAFVLVAVISLLAAGFAARGAIADAVAARVYLDVNPSFTLEVSDNGRILSVAASNEDAKNVLAGGEDEYTVGSLLGKIMKNGYLSEERDTMLLSVECEDDAVSRELIGKLGDDASAFLTENLPEGHAITQRVISDARVGEIAGKYGISKGAASFLIRLVGLKEGYTEDALASYDVTTLRRLCEENGVSTACRIAISSPDAAIIAEAAMRETLYDEPESATVYGYAEHGGAGVWRTEVRGSKYVAVYDVDADTGEVISEKHALCHDRITLLDAAISGAGYTADDIAHYDVIKDEKWNWLYVTIPSSHGEDLREFLSRDDADLDALLVCRVNLHTKDGAFLNVDIDCSTLGILSVKKSGYTYSIDTLDAVMIASEDAGLSVGVPDFPDSCEMADGICDLTFTCGSDTYHYVLDAFTGGVISGEKIR